MTGAGGLVRACVVVCGLWAVKSDVGGRLFWWWCVRLGSVVGACVGAVWWLVGCVRLEGLKRLKAGR